MKARLFSLLAVAAAESPVMACDCAFPSNLEEVFVASFENATAVFRGVSIARTAVQVDATYCEGFFERLPPVEQLKCYDLAEVDFVVSEVWKGDVPERLPVRTAPSDSACGTGLEEGREYVVFAYSIPNDDALHMHLCTLTTAKGWPRYGDLVALLGRRRSAAPKRAGP